MTDSFGSTAKSDASSLGHATATMPAVNLKSRMQVACVIDLIHTENLVQRQRAFDEVKLACANVGAVCHHIKVNIFILPFVMPYGIEN